MEAGIADHVCTLEEIVALIKAQTDFAVVVRTKGDKSVRSKGE